MKRANLGRVVSHGTGRVSGNTQSSERDSLLLLAAYVSLLIVIAHSLCVGPGTVSSVSFSLSFRLFSTPCSPFQSDSPNNNTYTRKHNFSYVYQWVYVCVTLRNRSIYFFKLEKWQCAYINDAFPNCILSDLEALTIFPRQVTGDLLSLDTTCVL